MRIGRDLNKYVNFVAVVAGFDLPDAKGIDVKTKNYFKGGLTRFEY